METSKEEQRWKFVDELESGMWSVTELCERYSVSRTTAYKWLRRVREEPSEAAYRDRSRRPRTCPHRTTADVEELLLKLGAQYGWGAKKLLQVLARQHPTLPRPARSTVNAILDRHGRLRKQRRRPRWQHPGVAPLATTRPNQVWPADFKGQFRLQTGEYCYPLTVTDHYSRKLLACRALSSTASADTIHAFRTLFRTVGLPEAIRTDNGAPFASRAIRGLTPLSVWWIQLGIVHQRIHPASPQENGQHERMHRDLKREATRPPAWTYRGQQQKFERFRRRFNDERPHDALDGALPSERWAPSPRPYPERLPNPEYPGHLEVRTVSSAGTFRFKDLDVFISTALRDNSIGLEQVDDGIWNVVYYTTLLAKLSERSGELIGDML
jgi:transposase InsO family protein